MSPESAAELLVWLCITAFFLRVFGQAMAAIYKPRWLPPMREWYSGIIPYGILLPAQLLVLQLMTILAYDFTRAEGALYVTSSRAIVAGVSTIYAAVIAVRTVLRLVRVPLRPWYGGRTLPIILHWVLAFFLFLISGYAVARS